MGPGGPFGRRLEEAVAQPPLLDEYIGVHGPIPLANASLEGDKAIPNLPDHIIASILLADWCCYSIHNRTDHLFRRLATLGKSSPTPAALIACTVMAFLRLGRKTPRQLALLAGDSVTFEDAFGQALELPFMNCQSHGQFRAFMETHYRGTPRMSYVLDNRYNLNLDSNRGMLVTGPMSCGLIKPNARLYISIILLLQSNSCPKCAKRLYRQGNGLNW